MGYCMCCGDFHKGKVCPPENFVVLICKKCFNESIMPGDAASLSMVNSCCQCGSQSWISRKATIEDMLKSNPDYGKYCTNIRSLDLKKINSATKYPSILTYHALGEKGCLKNEVLVSFEQTDLIATEKIDGVNSRIILFPKGMYLIGSREELLYAYGDIVHNSTLGIVSTIAHIAYTARRALWKQLEQTVLTIYGETYGGKTTKNARQYTHSGKIGFRIFDVAMMGAEEFDGILDLSIEKIASWRDHGGQKFFNNNDIEEFAKKVKCPVVPSLKISTIPSDIKETFDWLKNVLPGQTNASLEVGVGGKPEGLVVRTQDRSKIAKIRFEDYEKTFRK